VLPFACRASLGCYKPNNRPFVLNHPFKPQITIPRQWVTLVGHRCFPVAFSTITRIYHSYRITSPLSTFSSVRILLGSLLAQALRHTTAGARGSILSLNGRTNAYQRGSPASYLQMMLETIPSPGTLHISQSLRSLSTNPADFKFPPPRPSRSMDS
jgi:hypothetical protein